MLLIGKVAWFPSCALSPNWPCNFQGLSADLPAFSARFSSSLLSSSPWTGAMMPHGPPLCCRSATGSVSSNTKPRKRTKEQPSVRRSCPPLLLGSARAYLGATASRHPRPAATVPTLHLLRWLQPRHCKRRVQARQKKVRQVSKKGQREERENKQGPHGIWLRHWQQWARILTLNPL